MFHTWNQSCGCKVVMMMVMVKESRADLSALSGTRCSASSTAPSSPPPLYHSGCTAAEEGKTSWAHMRSPQSGRDWWMKLPYRSPDHRCHPGPALRPLVGRLFKQWQWPWEETPPQRSVARAFLHSPPGFSLPADSSTVCWRPRLAALASCPRMAARGAAWRTDPSPSFSDPASCSLSSVFLPCPSSSWITWHRKSWVSCWAAAWSSSCSTTGSSGSEGRVSVSSGSANPELTSC